MVGDKRPSQPKQDASRKRQGLTGDSSTQPPPSSDTDETSSSAIVDASAHKGADPHCPESPGSDHISQPDDEDMLSTNGDTPTDGAGVLAASPPHNEQRPIEEFTDPGFVPSPEFQTLFRLSELISQRADRGLTPIEDEDVSLPSARLLFRPVLTCHRSSSVP